MTDDKLHNALSRAGRAQELLNHDLLVEAYTKLEAALIAAWTNSDPRDNDGRERAWHAVQANRKHRDYLQGIVNDGKIAQADLNNLIAKAEHKKRFG